MERFHAWHFQIAVDHQRKDILKFIKETVALQRQDVNWYNVAVSALKKIIFFGDSSFGILPPVLRDSEGLYDVDEARRFISRVCWHVGEAAWKMMCARGDQAMKEKALKNAMAMLENEALKTAMLAKMEADVNRVDEELEKEEPKLQKGQELKKIKSTSEVTPDVGVSNAKSTQSRLEGIEFRGGETPGA
jgi:hypothetical protein